MAVVKDSNVASPTHQRQLGSPDDFECDWTEALSGNISRYLIYPADEPVTQFEMFERVKASHVDRLLAAHGLSGDLALEYGCGSAGMSVYLANRGFQAVVCDISLNALRLAKLNADQRLLNGARAHFDRVAGNTFQLPFNDRVFDLVMSYGLLEHFGLDVLGAALTEVVRTLRPGGLFIADIAHGRFSARTLGAWINLTASLVFHAVTLRWRRLPELPAAYLDHYYENDLDEQAWVEALSRVGLCNVNVLVCHPFPPLALSGWPEQCYVRLMQRARPAWEWFDRTQPGWGRRWGWLYLTWGTKPGEGN
jgi:SAM-dependent methyltransferase